MNVLACVLLRWKRTFRVCSTATVFLALALFPISPGCVRHEPPADIVIVNGGEPESLDPHIVVGQLDQRVSGSLFEGLLRYDPRTGDPIPGIAERFEVSTNGLLYTFYLRTNVVWSTGEPITAQDVLWSWRRAFAPETAADYVGQLFYIRNVEQYCTGQTNPATGRRYTAEDVAVRALDDYTFQVELISPTPFFPDLCAMRILTIVPRKAIEKYGDRWVRAPDAAFSGPFALEFWRVNDRIRVRKNPRYWDAENTHVNTVDFLPHRDATFTLNAFLSGEADIILDKRRVPSELLDVVRTNSYAHPFDYLCTFFFRFNTTRPPFNDARVRKALAMTVDKRRIVERITRGGEKPASYFTPPGMNYEPPQGLEYNPEAARKLLEEAGYSRGERFPLFRYLTPNTVQTVQTAVELQEMWQKELGIRMEIQQIEWKVFLNEQSRINFDISQSSWIGDYKDPNTFLDLFLSNNGNNRTGWKNSRYDALMRKANSQLGAKKRAALLREAESILVHDELPIVPLYFETGLLFYRPEEIDGMYDNLIDEHPARALRKKKPAPAAFSTAR